MKQLRKYAPLIARILLAAMFIPAGWRFPDDLCPWRGHRGS